MLIRLPSGAMTVNGTVSDEAMFKLYEQWRGRYGLGELSEPELKDRVNSILLRLRSLGITFKFGNQEVTGTRKVKYLQEYSGAWQIIDEVLKVLPDKFLKNEDLRQINFGSARVGAAMASAYDNHTVYIYAGGMKGSRRELVAKLVHELGHSTEDSLDPLTVVRLQTAHRKVQDSLIGLDILGGPEYRLDYQHSFKEFLADMHVIYVCAGSLLRERIESFPAGSRERKAWDYIYSVFRDEVFDGREYE